MMPIVTRPSFVLSCTLALLFAGAASAEGVDNERPPQHAQGVADEVPCDLYAPLTNIERCDTPRDGVLSGFYLGFDVGAVELNGRAEERIGVSLGPLFQLRLGFGFWDRVLLTATFGGLYPSDERSTTEEVVDCYSDVCDEAHAYSKDSSVGTEFLGLELGGQHRFRPTQGLSIAPGALLGVLEPTRELERGVECDGCSSVKLDADVGGFYVVPYVRFTFGRIGAYAAILRSQWFLSGDLLHATTLGFEYGLP